MTWKEINKKYEKEGGLSSFKKEEDSKLGKNWKSLMDSTDKLLWLFMISNEAHKRIPVNSGTENEDN
ncbi:MAG: hypothetical protein GX447_09545 [Elusimicrobia bacterium]|nr:hypothetical protein [Elusimicrobiota bacterium]